MVAGLQEAEFLFCHPGMSPQTGSGLHRDPSGLQYCRIYLKEQGRKELPMHNLFPHKMNPMYGSVFRRLTIEGVAQVDLVPKGVAELDANKFAVPRPLHILLPVALGVGVGFEGELGPNGIFT